MKNEALDSMLAAEVTVDTKLPGGCVFVWGIDGNSVKLEIDFRTSKGGWFYWAFRVIGAEGRFLRKRRHRQHAH